MRGRRARGGSGTSLSRARAAAQTPAVRAQRALSCRTPILRLFQISPRRFGAVLDCRGGREGRLVYKGFLSGVEMVPTGGGFPCKQGSRQL